MLTPDRQTEIEARLKEIAESQGRANSRREQDKKDLTDTAIDWGEFTKRGAEYAAGNSERAAETVRLEQELSQQ
jgi:hypothetical protein